MNPSRSSTPAETRSARTRRGSAPGSVTHSPPDEVAGLDAHLLGERSLGVP